MVSKFLGDWLTSESEAIHAEAMNLARSLKIKIDSKTLAAVAKNEAAPIAMRLEAMRGLLSQESPEMAAVLDGGLKSREPKIRIEALSLLAKSNAEAALKKVGAVMESRVATISEKQMALELLGRG